LLIATFLLSGCTFMYGATGGQSYDLYITCALCLILAETILILELLWLRSRHRKLGQDLIVTNDRLRLTLEGGGSVGWDWDVKSGQDQWFGDLERMFGIPSDIYSGRVEDFHRRVHPEDRELVAKAVFAARQNRTPYTAEFRIVREDGAVRWINARGKFYYSPDGDAVRMLGIATDITEGKQMEAALSESEERFSKAFRHSPLCITISRAKDSSYVDVNETFEQVTGWRREEIVGRTPFDIGLWINPEERVVMARRLAAGEAVRNIEFRVRTRKGDIRIGLGSAELVEMNGEPYVLSVSADITDLKLAEATLRESEERFRLMANTAPVMIWMAGADRQCNYVNVPWLEFTGRFLDEEIGKGWTDNIHPEDLARSWDTMTQAFHGREKFKLEYRVRRYDGEYRWVVDSGVPRFNADGSFAGYVGSVVDITDRKLVEEAQSRISQRLIEAQENERRWIARELHDDINQRLALLAAQLDRLQERLPSSTDELVSKIGDANAQALELGRDIQALSHRLHSSGLEHLGLAMAASGFCRELSTYQNVEIDFRSQDVPAGLPREIALCLFRVLQEALHNAVKHSGVRRFQVFLSGNPDGIELTVNDSGVGFDPEAVASANGLGLTSMRERLKLVNGQLSISSQLHHGTTIRACIPLSRRHTTARAG
jgi:PAS domain S-box-containing protein